jgi:outer membrane protein OmpA-like peptidoglycan-associated protein
MVENMKKIILVVILFGFMVSLTSCAYQNKQQKGTAVGAGVGAAAGAVIGQAIGRDTESTLLGAAIGAAVGGLAGNQIGAYMDRQEQALREALAASEAASIQRNQDVLTATFQSDVYFKFDSAILLPGGQREMDRVASVLNQYPRTTISVEGHTDAIGPEEYNLQLSERRARAVADALAQRNVYPDRISTVGFGESQLISSDPATNRRVNIVIEPIRRG